MSQRDKDNFNVLKLFVELIFDYHLVINILFIITRAAV